MIDDEQDIPALQPADLETPQLGKGAVQAGTTMETMLLKQKTTLVSEEAAAHDQGCIHKFIMFFTRNKRLMTRRRLTTDKDGNAIGSQKA